MFYASRVVYPDQSLVLESCADGAGRALACVFSSSDEFEAALIAERRAEGRYGPRKHRKRKLILCVGVALALAALLISLI
jgi:hypothetical protein